MKCHFRPPLLTRYLHCRWVLVGHPSNDEYDVYPHPRDVDDVPRRVVDGHVHLLGHAVQEAGGRRVRLGHHLPLLRVRMPVNVRRKATTLV